MEESTIDSSVEQHIQPPRVRVIKVLRNSSNASSQTIIKCSAKQPHRPTRSSVLVGDLDLKIRRLKPNLVKRKSHGTEASLNKSCLKDPSAHESNEASLETMTCHTSIHHNTKVGRLRLGLARKTPPAQRLSIYSNVTEDVYQPTYQARNKLVKVQKSHSVYKLQPFCLNISAYTQKSYSLQSLTHLSKGVKLNSIN